MSTAGAGLVDGMDRARRPTGPIVAVLVVVLCWVVGNLVGAVFVSGASGTVRLGPQVFLGVVVPGVQLLLLLAWLRWKEVRPFRTVGFDARPAGRAVGTGAVVGLVMFAAVALVGTGAGQLSLQGGRGGGAGLVGAAVLTLVAFTVAAVLEEVQTRGYLLQAGAHRWGLVAGVALQAVVFAALHLTSRGALNVLPVLNLLLTAVFLAGWAVLEGGLWGVCAWHAVWNWTEGTLFGAVVSGKPFETSLLETRNAPGSTGFLTGGAFGPEGGVLTTVVLLVGIGVLALVARRRRA